MDFAFRRAVAEARRQGKLYFAGLLSEHRILEAFGEARWLGQGWIYTPGGVARPEAEFGCHWPFRLLFAVPCVRE